MILAGDIGGTNTRLAFFREEGNRLLSVHEETFPSRTHSGLAAIVQQFLLMHKFSPAIACFGVAGPVKNGRGETTNLPWIVDAKLLSDELHIPTVLIINDLEAAAYGVTILAPTEWAVLNTGAPDAVGNAAVIAAGTGLGEAGLYWNGQSYRPFATEGGHTDFAPRSPLEIELLRFLLARFDRVSYERVLSGPGLVNIYQFLRETGRGDEPTWLAEELRLHDPAAVISQAALAERSALCMQALDLFVAIYGAEAGNLTLKLMATGGIFIGGGIAPQIVPKLMTPTFMQAFLTKGRMRPVLEATPVRVILHGQTALLGAARCAMLHASR
ncbi:MAG: glucokinase [Candidatus Binatia bacterium]